MSKPDPLLVTCTACARQVPIERTRLFWSHGTYRVCANTRSCRKAQPKTAGELHRERYGEDHP